MQSLYHPHRVVLLASRFQYPDHRLLFPRARLFMDRIELSGWDLGRRHVQSIMLDQVAHIEWNQDQSTARFLLENGSSIELSLPHVSSWKETLDQRLSWSAPGRFPAAAATYSTPRIDLSLHDLVTFTTSMG